MVETIFAGSLNYMVPRRCFGSLRNIVNLSCFLSRYLPYITVKSMRETFRNYKTLTQTNILCSEAARKLETHTCVQTNPLKTVLHTRFCNRQPSLGNMSTLILKKTHLPAPYKVRFSFHGNISQDLILEINRVISSSFPNFDCSTFQKDENGFYCSILLCRGRSSAALLDDRGDELTAALMSVLKRKGWSFQFQLATGEARENDRWDQKIYFTK
jgi:hypothetical protein